MGDLSRSFQRGSRLLIAAAVFSAACAIGGSSTYSIDGPARAARDTPVQFVTLSGEIRADTSASPGCLSPLIDPRDGTRLTLVNSQSGRVGDYSVGGGRYGVGNKELLRLECGTGRVIGIIPDTR
jgi:hypothetical protein